MQVGRAYRLMRIASLIKRAAAYHFGICNMFRRSPWLPNSS
jgi:hypothetical protein